MFLKINQDSSHILSSDLYDLILVTTALDSHLREQNLFDLYCNIEMPISTLLAVMETRGIQVVLDTMIISCNFILVCFNACLKIRSLLIIFFLTNLFIKLYFYVSELITML